MNSKSLLFNFSNAMLFSLEVSVKVFVNFSEVFLITLVTGFEHFFLILVKVLFTYLVL